MSKPNGRTLAQSVISKAQGKQWRGLQAHMTISYVWVTLLSLLLLECLLLVLVLYIAFSFIFPAFLWQQARSYARAAAVQASDTQLNPQSTFRPHQAYTLLIPNGKDRSDDYGITYIEAHLPASQQVSFALLLGPDGQVVASSYPSRYPLHGYVRALLPEQTDEILTVLRNQEASPRFHASLQGSYSSVVPVWSRTHQLLGAVYLQIPAPTVSIQNSATPILLLLIIGGLLLLLIVAPIGGLFGLLTTRGLVGRLRTLVSTTATFTAGDYTKRVRVLKQDEVGQLERQLNVMADELEESISQRQRLAAQNARLEERSRIARELHDAVSQDLFSLRMLADGLDAALQGQSQATHLASHITLLRQTSDKMAREMRAMLLEMRPTELEHLSLAEALKELVRIYSQRLDISVQADVEALTLDARSEHALLRLAQEALSNAVRHADATYITLGLHTTTQMVHLTIIDNGKGFTPAMGEQQHGLGLRVMRERVEELQGTFTIQSLPEQGTTITITLPGQRKEEDHD